jgi:hypothetical protein
MADEDVQVKFGGEIGGLRASMTQIRETMQGLVDPIRGLRNNLGELAEAFLAAFAVERVDRFVESLTKLNEETETASLVLGMSMDKVAGLQAAAEAAGAGPETLTRAFGRMGNNLTEQSDQTKRAIDFLGLSFKQLNTQAPIDQFEELGQALMKVQNVSSRNAASNAIFGRGFQELATLLGMSKEELEGWQRTVDETGASLTRASPSLDQTKDEMVALGLATRGDGIDVFMEFRGAVDGVFQILHDLAVSFHQAMAEGGMMKDIMDGVSFAFKGLVTAIAATIIILETFWTLGVGALDVVGLAVMALGPLIAAVGKDIRASLTSPFHTLMTVAAAAIEGTGKIIMDLVTIVEAVAKDIDADFGHVFSHMVTMASTAVQKVGELYNKLAGTIGASTGDSSVVSKSNSAFASLVSHAEDAGAKIKAALADIHLDSGLGKDAAKVLDDTNARIVARIAQMNKDLARINKNAEGEDASIWGGPPDAKKMPAQTNKGVMAPEGKEKTDKAAKEELEDQLSKDNEIIASEKRATAMAIAGYESQAKTKQITESEKVQFTLAALASELAVEMATLNQELALGDLSLKQKRDILNKMKEIQDQNAAAVQKVENDAAENTYKTWETNLSKITSAFDSQLRPLLSRTESFGEAFKKIIADMVIKFIEGAVKMGAQWIATEAVKTTATAAGVAAQKSINATSVMGDAGRAAAGAYASVSSIPIIGPFLAPAAAAAAYAGTLAVGAMDIGAYNLPEDQMALVHKQELVMPAEQASAFRSLLETGVAPQAGSAGQQSGGDTHIHFAVNAVDAAGVQSFFKNNARHMLTAINHGIKSGSHLGLKRIGG